MYSIRNREDLENLEELASLKNLVEEIFLEAKLGEQNFHESVKKLQEPLIDRNKSTSENLTKTITET